MIIVTMSDVFGIPGINMIIKLKPRKMINTTTVIVVRHGVINVFYHLVTEWIGSLIIITDNRIDIVGITETWLLFNDNMPCLDSG